MPFQIFLSENVHTFKLVFDSSSAWVQVGSARKEFDFLLVPVNLVYKSGPGPNEELSSRCWLVPRYFIYNSNRLKNII